MNSNRVKLTGGKKLKVDGRLSAGRLRHQVQWALKPFVNSLEI